MDALVVAYIARVENDLRTLIFDTENRVMETVNTAQAEMLLSEMRSVRDEVVSLISAFRAEAASANQEVDDAASEAVETVEDVIDEVVDETADIADETTDSVLDALPDELLPNDEDDDEPSKRGGFWTRKL